MEQHTKRLTRTLGAIGIAAGLGLGAAGLAGAATSPSTNRPSNPATGAETGSSDTGNGQQDPQLNGSVQVPEAKGGDETTEAASLKAAAKVTPAQAESAALAAVPGTVQKVELDNENGSVVYSVEIVANGTTTDVKVDAGNAKVLAQDSGEGQDKQENGTEKGGTEKSGTEKSGTEKAGTETADTGGATG